MAPDTIERGRLTAWLGQHADVPLRLVCAPGGSGKTTALVAYAAESSRRVIYMSVDGARDVERFRERLAEAVGANGTGEAQILIALAGLGRCELFIDEADRGDAEVRAILERLVYDVPVNVTLAYATRSRDVVDATRLIAIGLARVLDGERLAFTVDEAMRFVAALGLDVDQREVTHLLHDTEGWPFAFCATAREALSHRITLAAAFERFRSSPLLRRFVERNFAEEPEELIVAARKAYDGAALDVTTLDRLEGHGLFVRWTGEEYRPYRVLARASRLPAARQDSAVTLEPFIVRLLGEPEVRLGDRRVSWFRRRDAQIFAYLALRPDGRASRSELLEAFWPETSRRIASQTLRSACSTMRRSLAAVVGYAEVSHYLAIGDDLALNLDLFVIDARSMEAHLRDAEAARARGELDVEREHREAAQRLAGGALLGGAVPECLAARAAELQEQVDALLGDARDRRRGEQLPLVAAVG